MDIEKAVDTNTQTLAASIAELAGSLCQIRNVLILSALATGENKDRGVDAKVALDKMAVELKLLQPINLSA